MVALTTGTLTRGYFCGGSLVTDRHVLTAAHCITPVFNRGALLSSIRGIVGTYYWSNGASFYTFSHNVTHSNWDQKIVKNDIDILVTSSAVSLNAVVQTVALNFDFVEVTDAIVHGWGRFNINTYKPASKLMELRPYIVDGNQCVTDVARRSKELKRPVASVDPELEICTYLGMNFGTCQGDSGSALLLKQNRQQIGIVSWGLPCALGAPDIYVESAYQSWIQQNLR